MTTANKYNLIQFKPFVLVLMLTTMLNGCDSNDSAVIVTPQQPEPPAQLIAFDDDNHLQANIKWTRYGVPHITADNLESLSFGTGYAYAKDNLCVLADQMIKISSQRAKYFGPDKVPGSGDFTHVISDFGYKALGLDAIVSAKYDTLGDNTRAMVEGYAAGYNQYLADTGIEHLAVECANQAWVQPITGPQIVSYILSAARLGGATEPGIMALAFFANPSNNYLPYPTADQKSGKTLAAPNPNIARIDLSQFKNSQLGSNAWALGQQRSENGKGALIANPHFAHHGNLRFWQSHQTIPGVLNVMGASLQGFPAINIGFNEAISWTHTVSTSRHFALYQLAMNPDDPMVYMIDGEPHNLEKKTYSIDVALGDGNFASYSKDYYYSIHGLMIEVPDPSSPFAWTNSQAFTLKDANEANLDTIEHWFAMNLATDLDAFKQTFIDYSGIPFTNTIYADKAGNTFFIDDSPVFNFSETAQSLMQTEPAIIAARQVYNLDVLPGDNSVFHPDSMVPYQSVPKLQRSDYVQNSNDSYWATNTDELLSDYAISFGEVDTPLSFRTRMSLKLLDDSGGDDNKFNLAELETALLNNRLYLSELIKDSLLQQCQAQGDTPVMLAGQTPVNIAPTCSALASWDGTANLNSQAAHVFREFAYNFDPNQYFTVPFDATNPASTPNTLTEHADILQLLALATENISQAGFALDATLGQMQFVEKSLPGNIAGPRLPWAGGTHVEGGFNIYSAFKGSDETLLPNHTYASVTDVLTGQPLISDLSSQGYQIKHGSSWMFVLSFEDDGPVARGLMTYSQSAQSQSEYFSDQSQHYSDNVSLRPLYFKAADIDANTVASMELSSQ